MANRGARTLAAILAFVALSAAPAHAIDGEVLINHQAALDGGITSADTPGYPITLNKGGHYKLIGNLSVPANKIGIQVTAHNVTINLNGFRIAGSQTATTGISAPNADGLTVMDGTITRFQLNGIKARAYAIIQDMQITNNGGMGVRLDNTGRVLRSTISENTSLGIFCNSRCLIAQNVITRSATEAGIGLFTSAGGHLVLGNTIAGNQLFGIYAEGPTGFGNNTLVGNNPGGAVGGTQILGAVFPLHPNFCQPACP